MCGGASARAISSRKIAWCVYGAPPPPYCLGPGQPRIAGVEERMAPGAHRRLVESGSATSVAPELVGKVRLEPLAQLGPERRLLGRVAQIHGRDASGARDPASTAAMLDLRRSPPCGGLRGLSGDDPRTIESQPQCTPRSIGAEGAGLEPEPIARSQRLSIVHRTLRFRPSADVEGRSVRPCAAAATRPGMDLTQSSGAHRSLQPSTRAV